MACNPSLSYSSDLPATFLRGEQHVGVGWLSFDPVEDFLPRNEQHLVLSNRRTVLEELEALTGIFQITPEARNEADQLPARVLVPLKPLAFPFSPRSLL